MSFTRSKEISQLDISTVLSNFNRNDYQIEGTSEEEQLRIAIELSHYVGQHESLTQDEIPLLQMTGFQFDTSDNTTGIFNTNFSMD